MIPAERNRPADRIAASIIAGITVAAVGGTWFFSDARQAKHNPAAEAIVQHATPEKAPDTVTEAWRATTVDRHNGARPVVADGAVVAEDDHGFTAIDAATGETAWDYSRQRELCGTTAAWGKVVAVYRGPAGCGDVIAFDSLTGAYTGTRSAVSADNVAVFSSNSRVGTVSDQRVELWRSDLVRTVEYGRVESANEPKAQPRAGCRIHSALTRTELLAVVDTCPKDGGTVTSLRMSATTPDDARTPEETASVQLDSERAVLVGISQEAAAVYVGGDRPILKVVSSDGTVLSETKVPKSPTAETYLDNMVDQPLPDPGPGKAHQPATPAFLPATGDLPHHMTWFDGERLYGFEPTRLGEGFTLKEAIGVGAAMGSDLLIPVSDGLMVLDKTTGEKQRTIAVNRGDYTGPVSVSVTGNTIIERRGTDLIALR
ncbi:PQQ-binding-like beta-propeller repeat protein [Corynebacterium ulceribovis]|uniref:Rv3212 family protein n=1 Tax=Corynebacterium ulceribovis TaxID=487732 RepID=UPI00037D9F8C|nr:PQQ-binding-like beta-propeller repeat protein [Corynebacterium ulceribovis]